MAKRYKAVFLDRDGVINDGSLYYTFKIEDFKLNDGIIESLQLLQNDGYLLVIVTNQGGVAKGLYSEQDVELLHDYMTELLSSAGIIINGVYVCPHHSDVVNCSCRKPKPGMLLQAIEELNINPACSFMIGDSTRDIEAGEAAGIHSFKINKNQNILPLCREIIKLY